MASCNESPTEPHEPGPSIHPPNLEAGDGVAHAFMQRLSRAVSSLGGALTRDEQLRALGEPDDTRALIRALLTRNSALVPDFDHQMLAARLRGVAAKQELASEEGGCLPIGELRRLLGKSRQAIEKQREARQIFAVEFSSPRGWYYPQWQFDGVAPWRGLAEVLRELPPDDPWAAMIFFLRTHVDDGETPLQALREGKKEAVLRAARTFASQGAT